MKIVTVMLVFCALVARSEAASLAIDEARFESLGGIDQWITIRGASASAPVLLWIHGGPADVQSPLISVYEPWAQRFRFVQWDQRGAGKTFKRNPGPPERVSLADIARDGIELVERLRAQLRVRQVILGGHSWGTIVALEMLQQRPELFSAYIGAGQVTSWRDTVKWQYEHALKRAREAGDDSIVQELETAGLPPHDDLGKYFAMRRQLAKYFPKVDQEWISREQLLYTSELGAAADDAKTFASAGQFSGPRLMPTIFSIDLRAHTSRVPIPFCVIQGEADTFTPTPLASMFFEGVSAPRKHFATIKDAGHFAPMTHAHSVLDAIDACLAG